MQDARSAGGKRQDTKKANRLLLSCPWIVPGLVCLVAFGMRLGPLWANRFHSDEALYASWALGIANGRDLLLAGASLDKPPLLFYTMAVAFLALGRVEVAARLAGLMAGVVSVALVWRLAGGMARSVPPYIAAAAMALSPFGILFSPTAFLDPLMVMLALASLVAMMRKRPGWAGAFLGLAAATKVQALIFLPLVIAYRWLTTWTNSSLYHQDAKTPSFRTWKSRNGLYDWATSCLGVFVVRIVIGLAIPLVIVLAWDRLRGSTPFWIQQTINYGGIRPIYASEVMPRLMSWLGFLPHFFGWPMLIALAVGVPLLLVYDLTRDAGTRAAVLDWVLVTFTLGYFFLHWLLAFPVWDRYLLGLVPVMCLLIGRLGDWVVRWSGDRFQAMSSVIVVALVLALLAPAAAQASQSAIPIGGDHGPRDGIDRISAYLRLLPYGDVVYDHWLGWDWRYYLWDAHAYVAYFATPEALAQDLRIFGRTSPRYIVFPADESTMRIERAIASEGYEMSPVLSTQDRHGQPTFTLYRILSADHTR